VLEPSWKGAPCPRLNACPKRGASRKDVGDAWKRQGWESSRRPPSGTDPSPGERMAEKRALLLLSAFSL